VASEPTETEGVDLPELMKRARGGSEKAAHEVKRRYADRPEAFRQLAESVASIARSQMLGAITQNAPAVKNDKLFSQATADQLAKMEADLAGPNPSPIETMLASRIVTCWLDAHVLDTVATAGNNCGVSLKDAEHRDKLRTRAHDRLMKAFKTLAYVRRVDLNVLLQVNQGPSQTIVGKGQRLE
jgi:hypothetical protein